MDSPGAPAADAVVAPETSQVFFRFFQQELKALQQQMERLGDTALAGGERIDATEHCSAGINRLARDVADASAYLPAYDQRTYGEAIKALQERLEKTRTEHAPKQKFVFRNARKNASAISLSDVAHLGLQRHPNIPAYGSGPPSLSPSNAATPELPSTPFNEQETDAQQQETGNILSTWAEEEVADQRGCVLRPSFLGDKSIKLANQRSARIILPAEAGHATGLGTVMSLSHCFVDMSKPTSIGRPFAGLTLRRLEKSLIVCGHVAGSAHLTQLSDCVIVVACRQLRMHECLRCDVYLHAASRPIVEDVSGVRFAPLPELYTTENDRHAENMWHRVDDFKWLKNEQSPNWATIPQQDRLSEEAWAKAADEDAASGLENVLAAVGIRDE